jgi:myo-inositol-1(or 4)-monophosphatase
VSSCEQLADAVVIASRTEISRDQFAPYDGWFQELRPVGSIAWKLACIACGDGDLNISVAPKNEWDVCAGDLLVREAGGIYVDFAGATRRYNQPKTLIDTGMGAGRQPLLEQFFERCRQSR